MNDTTKPASLHLEELTTNIKGPTNQVINCHPSVSSPVTVMYQSDNV